MTRSRLVAAVAALAVGFGITLVGTTVADSDGTDDPAAVEQSDGSGQDVAPDSGDDAAQDDAAQEVAEAEEPDAATVETEPAAAEPVEPAPETTAEGSGSEGDDDLTRGDGDEGSGPDAERDPSEPSTDAERSEVPEGCFDVIVIEDDLNGDVVLRKGLDYQVVDGEVALINDFAIDDRQLVGVEEVSVKVDDRGIFFCADGREVDDVVYDWFYAAPCDGDVRDYFEDFFFSLDVSDDEVAFSDDEVFLFVVAERIERVNTTTDRFDEFFLNVVETFAGFPDDCSPTVVDADLSSQQFFCAAGNLSATDDLLGYLEDLELVSSGCGYDA